MRVHVQLEADTEFQAGFLIARSGVTRHHCGACVSSCVLGGDLPLGANIFGYFSNVLALRCAMFVGCQVFWSIFVVFSSEEEEWFL